MGKIHIVHMASVVRIKDNVRRTCAAPHKGPKFSVIELGIFFRGGTKIIMDQTIVSGSGIYEKYTLGRVEQKIHSR